MSAPRTVAVVGAGTVGAGWAAWFALHGLEVRVYDAHEPTRQTVAATVNGHLRRLVDLGLAEAAQAAAARLCVVESLEAAAAGADFVQESVLETYAAKKAVFSVLDACTPPETLLASSSSGLLISEIQTVMRHPERALIAHPFNPPYLIPLVELVAGPATAPDTIERARRFFSERGKQPVVLQKEVPGHLANRLAAALWREAIDLVAQGVATVEDVDTALRAGPGLRWAVMGQHMIYHLGGGQGGYGYFIDHIGKAFEQYWQTMPTWSSIPAEARAAIVAGVEAAAHGRTLEELAQERDRKLVAVLKALRDATP
jgi:3-hydroxyacyl-CoA dehydrogenase